MTEQRPRQAEDKPSLPLEINEEIIDFSHDDKQTLFACSLVCKHWVPRTRFHLPFASPSIKPGAVKAFLDVINSPWSTIPVHVRTIAFKGMGQYDPKYEEVIFALCKAGVNLTTFHLQFYPTPSIDLKQTALSFFASSFPRLVHLSIHIEPTIPNGLLSFCCSFQYLESLALNIPSHQLNWRGTSDPGEQLSQTLRSITITVFTPRYFMDWLLKHHTRPLLTALTLRNCAAGDPADTSDINKYLQTAQNHLRHLTLDFNYNHGTIDLAPLHNLETIAFQVVEAGTLASVHESLQSATGNEGSSLREVTINCCWNAPWAEWRAAGHIVLKNFPALQLLHIHFMFGGSVDYHGLLDTFSDFQEKGVLLVSDSAGRRLN